MHVRIRALASGRLYQDNPIRSDAHMAITDTGDLFSRKLDPVVQVIDENKVVSRTMNFLEWYLQASSLTCSLGYHDYRFVCLFPFKNPFLLAQWQA